MGFIQIGTAPAQTQTRFHNGLPAGWQRDRFRQTCVAYAQIMGCSADCIRTFEIIIDLISPDQFLDPTKEPFCYARQETLIGERVLNGRSIRRHERQLEQIGLIERRLGANGARCRRKRLGLFLTPALNNISRMFEEIEAQRAHREAHDALRGDRSRLLKHMRATLEALAETGIATAEVEEIRTSFLAWPRSDRLCGMAFEELKKHVDSAREDLLQLLSFVKEIDQKPAKESGQPDSRVRSHIQDKTEDKILSCNPPSGDKRPSGKPEDIESLGEGPNGPSRCLEKQDVEGGEDHKSDLLLPRISNQGIYALASEEMRMHIDIAGGGMPNSSPTLYAIETGVWTRLSEIGTNLSAWHDAIAQMGPLGAIVAGVLTDAKVSDPSHPVANPGGYFRGMTRAAKRDDLNLVAGWMGLVARRDREETRGEKL